MLKFLANAGLISDKVLANWPGAVRGCKPGGLFAGPELIVPGCTRVHYPAAGPTRFYEMLLKALSLFF